METLINSTLLHFLMILLILIAIILIIVFKGQIIKHEASFSKTFGISTLCIWVIYNIYNFLPLNFIAAESLPLQLCDILAVTSVITLLTRNKKASAFLYFCAIPLASQAIITPTGEQNPFLFKFWLFWALHASIIINSVYDIIIRKYRPTIKSYLFTLICDIIYIIVILPIDIILNFNYGFIGNTSPDVATMIDIFGPWPLRVLWLFLAVAIVQFLMYVSWKIKTKDNSINKKMNI